MIVWIKQLRPAPLFSIGGFHARLGAIECPNQPSPDSGSPPDLGLRRWRQQCAGARQGHADPKPLPPLANPNDPKIGAKELFGRKVLPAAMPTRVIGFYAKGCIAGAEALPINGGTWQVMRLSRNRNWAHPDMVELLERLSVKAHKDAGWPGILVGDMAQPRGGPMITGHASHQIGLDADVWLTPMPDTGCRARSARKNRRS